MSDKTSDTAVSSFYIGTPRSFNVGIIVMTTMLEYRNPASRHPRPTSEQPRRRLPCSLALYSPLSLELTWSLKHSIAPFLSTLPSLSFSLDPSLDASLCRFPTFSLSLPGLLPPSVFVPLFFYACLLASYFPKCLPFSVFRLIASFFLQSLSHSFASLRLSSSLLAFLLSCSLDPSLNPSPSLSHPTSLYSPPRFHSPSVSQLIFRYLSLPLAPSFLAPSTPHLIPCLLSPISLRASLLPWPLTWSLASLALLAASLSSHPTRTWSLVISVPCMCLK